MTKYVDRNKFRKEETPIVAGDEWTKEPSYKRELYCKWCNHLLHKVQDHGNNWNFWCANCQIQTPLEKTDDLKGKSKVFTPTSLDHSDDPAVAYPPEPGLKRNTVEYKGGFKALRDKGVRITHYTEGKC